MYSMVTTVNAAIYKKVVKRVIPKHSHYKEKIFFFFSFGG